MELFRCFYWRGCSVSGKDHKKVRGVEWLDLGIPEALWIFEVENFGPLTAAIDSHGCNLFMEVARKAEDSRS